MSNTDKQVEGFDDASAEPGVWQYAHARRVRVVVDGEDYFDLIQQAMLKAKQRILLIGWDFDTRIHLSRGRRWWQKGWKREYPSRLGSFIVWLSNHRPDLEIRILKWSYGVLKFLGRGSMMLDLARWWPHRRIDFKFDTNHPIGCSHHQKIVVIDDDFAVCGGIDMTTRRWDTREHKANDHRRKQPSGAPYEPWHDVTMMMEGDVAGALEKLGRHRWLHAGGGVLSAPTLDEGSTWPDGLEPHFENVEIGIARTRAKHDELAKVDEIEELFLKQIAEAKHFIYAENQYFTSRTISEAIARRLDEADPPEIVIICPKTAEGWIEEQAMSPARAKLVAALEEMDKHDRFHIYVPYAKDMPIYVHAKLMIVDDKVLRIGSANMNNRSMGLDSECDVFIDTSRPANSDAGAAITALRHSLLAEHLGIREDAVPDLLERHGSMAALIEAAGDKAHRHLRPFHPELPKGLLDELADRQTFDPEEPEDLFEIRLPRHGLFRDGSLLARARNRLRRKNGH
ncbi:phospholipase D-like domain-containing protein [Aurantiacibacter gangjinensis]|uniref:Phospholipase D n=1 Tax=Aurantiacibacter gangjinensis TaxID=502682 RepID=A0A0G9MQP1_9SPHN|nr:phospholipase D-like domain-containing protein [Aurantiacibacter gangjinensis]APE28927.1 Phospholipase D/Transphosphatidylase [Aurantiacibacter gangjinensis]KLE33052.1 phospholipase D [Aurantiacibacter gangjinensis]